MTNIKQRLERLGIVLPPAPKPLANYVGFVQTGNLLIISGQLPLGVDGMIAPAHIGKLGVNISEDDACAAARACALAVLAQAQAALGDLDRIVRCLRLGGFLNCVPDYANLAPVMNGASDVVVEILGEAGRHARATIGVAQLPMGAVAEVEAMFEIC